MSEQTFHHRTYYDLKTHSSPRSTCDEDYLRWLYRQRTALMVKLSMLPSNALKERPLLSASSMLTWSSPLYPYYCAICDEAGPTYPDGTEGEEEERVDAHARNLAKSYDTWCKREKRQ